MLEYLLEFLILLLVVFVVYLVYDRFLRQSPEPKSGLYNEALRDLLDGRHESAFSKLRQVVSEEPNNLDAYLRLGQILRENNQPDRALQIHKDLTLRSGLTRQDKVAILQQIAADSLAADDAKMGEAAIKELLELDSDNYWGYAKLLELQEKNKEWGAAYDTAVQILRLEGNRSKKPLAQFKHRAGEHLFRQREYHKARILFKEAIGLDPTLVEAYLAIGDSYYEEERFEDAITFWNKLVAAVPDQGHRVIDRLRKTLFDLGRYGEIQTVCEEILEHSPKNTEVRRALAEFYQKKGDLDTAAEVWEGIVDDDPDDAYSALELVGVYLEQGETRKATKLLRGLEHRRTGKKAQPPVSAQEAPLPRTRP